VWGAGFLRELRLGRPVLVRAIWTDAARGQRIDGDLSPLLTDPVGSRSFSFVSGQAAPQQEWLLLSHPSPLVTDCKFCYLRMTGQGKWVFDLTQQNPPPPPDPFNPPGGGGGQEGGGIGTRRRRPSCSSTPRRTRSGATARRISRATSRTPPERRFGLILGGTPPPPPNGEPAPPFEVIKQAVPNQNGHASEVWWRCWPGQGGDYRILIRGDRTNRQLFFTISTENPPALRLLEPPRPVQCDNTTHDGVVKVTNARIGEVVRFSSTGRQDEFVAARPGPNGVGVASLDWDCGTLGGAGRTARFAVTASQPGRQPLNIELPGVDNGIHYSFPDPNRMRSWVRITVDRPGLGPITSVSWISALGCSASRCASSRVTRQPPSRSSCSGCETERSTTASSCPRTARWRRPCSTPATPVPMSCS
jgi:hypothetical protein